MIYPCKDISRYIPDHKDFDAKTAIYIACTNSLSIVGFNYEALAYFEGLLTPICSDKKKIKDNRRYIIGRHFG